MRHHRSGSFNDALAQTVALVLLKLIAADQDCPVKGASGFVPQTRVKPKVPSVTEFENLLLVFIYT